jgi:hypothetical protein
MVNTTNDLTTVKQSRAIDAREIVPKLELFAVDSMRIMLRKSAASSINPLIFSTVVVSKTYVDGDEIIDELPLDWRPADAITYEGEGYICTYKGVRRVERHGKAIKEEEYIYIDLSSKSLREDYLRGITYNTLDKVVDAINNQGYITVTKQALLQARITDVDVKSDAVMTEKETRELVNCLYASVSPDYAKVARKYNQARNVGFEIGKRDNEKSGYIKWYNKTIQLPQECLEFNSKFVGLYPALSEYHIMRTELTIKDKKQAVKYGILEAHGQQFTLDKMLAKVADVEYMKGLFAAIITERIPTIKAAKTEKEQSNNTMAKLSQSQKDVVYKMAKTFALANTSITVTVAAFSHQYPDPKKMDVARKVIEEAYADVEQDRASNKIEVQGFAKMLPYFN